MGKNTADVALREAVRNALARVEWPLAFGTIKITLRDGKPTLHTIEVTDKLD